MEPSLYAKHWAALDRAERLALFGTEQANREAIALAVWVAREAERARSEVEPSPWDGGAWAQCTVLMTRASLLLLRLRRAQRRLAPEWAGRGPVQPMQTGEDPDEPSPPSRSSVRPRTSRFDHRILLVEPDAAVRRQLLDEASSVEAHLIAVATPDEAAAIRGREEPTFIACHFPLPGAVRLVEELHRERFPVGVVTSEVLRAVATFGFDVPVLPTPLSLIQLLEQAHELAGARSTPPPVKVALSVPQANPSRERAVTEVVVPPRRRDPRRE